ncbi:MAG: T9SS type A sorting domain-containing protein, partial [Bacteroidota bacterium]
GGLDFRVGKASCFFKSVFCEECQSESTTEQISGDCSTTVNIDETDESHVRIFPNPSNGILTVRGLNDKVPFEIMDSFGRIVESGLLENRLNLTSLTAGVYIFRYELDGETEVLRWIKN